MARDADPIGLVARFPDLLAVIENHMSTDFPVEQLPDLIKLAPRVESETIRVIGFDSKWGTGRTPDGAIIPDVARIRQTVAQMIDDPAASETLGAATAEAACG
jgi:hypothetical protein